MTFGAVHWLWLLLLPPLLWLLQQVGDRRAAARLVRLVGERGAEHVEDPAPRRRRWRRGLLLLALAAMAVGLARPQWGTREVVMRQRGPDFVVALDVSNSMRAEDVAPSRLVRARAALADLVAGLDDGRVGIVLFAGAAFVQCPLTADRATAQLFLRMADTEMISEQGTNLAAALAVGRKLLGGGDRPPGELRAICLVTDGEDLEGGWQAEVARCREEGIVVHAVGVGSREGGLIPVVDARGRPDGFLKDEDGTVVMSRLDTASLAELARLGGGEAILLDDPEAEPRLRRAVAGLSERELEERRIAARQERYHWPLGLALLALAVREALRIGPRRRRGAARAAAAGLLLAGLLAAPPAGAGMLRPDGAPEAEQGVTLYLQGRYDDALAAFEAARARNPREARLSLAVGAALQALGRHDEAVREFERAYALTDSPRLRAESLYDAGTTLLAAGDAAGASERLRRSLALEPERDDALRNLEAALRALARTPADGGDRGCQDGDGQGSPQQPQEGSDRQQGRQERDGRQGEGGSPQADRPQQGRQDQGRPQPDQAQPDQAQPDQEGRDQDQQRSQGTAGRDEADRDGADSPSPDRPGADEGQRREEPRSPEREKGSAAADSTTGEAGRGGDRREGEPQAAAADAAAAAADSTLDGRDAMSRARALEILRGLDRDEEELRRSVQRRLRGGGSTGGRRW